MTRSASEQHTVYTKKKIHAESRLSLPRFSFPRFFLGRFFLFTKIRASFRHFEKFIIKLLRKFQKRLRVFIFRVVFLVEDFGSPKSHPRFLVPRFFLVHTVGTFYMCFEGI